MKHATTKPGSPPGEWTRVVALATPTVDASSDSASVAPISAALAEEFQNRDWFAIVAHDPYLALAELALRERAQAARTAWGLQRMEGLALVVIEPTRWPQAILNDLFASVKRWLPPSVTIWKAENDCIASVSQEFLPSGDFPTRVDSPVPTNMEALIAALPREQSASAHVNGSDRPASPAPPASRTANSAPPERLSREEIDMLLRDDSEVDSNRDATSSEGGA